MIKPTRSVCVIQVFNKTIKQEIDFADLKRGAPNKAQKMRRYFDKLTP